MTQQYVFGHAGDKYKKQLFVDTGFGYEKVRARIIEPYMSPVPTPNTKEIKIINAPSHIHEMGLSSYRVTLNLLFDTKTEYTAYMSMCGFSHKFYDERGAIFVGALESIKSTPVEASRKYKVEVVLVLVKKDNYDFRNKGLPFQDISTDTYAYNDILDMARLGLVSTSDGDGDPVLYFYPWSDMTRAEFLCMLWRTKKFIEKALRE